MTSIIIYILRNCDVQPNHCNKNNNNNNNYNNNNVTIITML